MKKKILIIAFLVLIVVIAGIIVLKTMNNNSSNSNTQQTVTKQITSTEVAAHNTSSSCWTVINGNVYDVTDYIPTHPGGSRILQACGIDATSIFTSIHSSGRPASVLVGYQIGVLTK